ncbi:universal stress protein [Oxalobacteraceae bacterium R-40]|uniref:Universal stress protein n=1 Tax=Keguizhuia sedimenti TaxID=3064264 RepID=A0ABU1BTJ0_9BURK|nr:universal stress protein [Oxalobacteraceae bacterium R-40]
MKIIVAIDGSSCSVKAVEYLAKHLNWFQGSPELTLVHVHHPIPGGVAVSRARAIAGDAVVDEHYREESKAQMAAAEKVLTEQNIPFRSEYVVSSDIAREIDHHARKVGADMIVMGSHGHGALANVVMGSVATKVLAMAHCPVLIIR